MSHLSLEVVLQREALSALAVWEKLYSSHRQYFDVLIGMELDQTVCQSREVAKRIRERGMRHFGIAWNDERLDYGHVANSDISLLLITGCVRDKVDAESWLTPLISDRAFRQARLYDTEYDLWQNAKDPLEYEVAGRSREGLPMRSNGFPPPLERMVIDTSHNAGRRTLRQGFVEFVGSPMWLGDTLWSIVRTNREAVCSHEWLRCESLGAGVTRLTPSDAPFTTAEGSAGDIQRHLRTLLYPGINHAS